MVFELLYQPQPDISYKFIFRSYLLCSGLCVLLFLLEKFHVEAVKSYYVVFLPFIPCLLWAAFMQQKASSLKNKTD